jgi:23S rRNA (guanosine2251-2'-O)-methyltransferase
MITTEEKDFIFGIRPIQEAITAGKEIDRILIEKDLKSPHITELITTCIQLHIPFVRVPVEKLNRITKKNHQGVIAYLSSIVYASLDHVVTEAFAAGRNPLILILDRITDVRNFGAIARTAECAGVDAIVVPEKNSARIGGDAFKTSAGALSFIPVCREQNMFNAIKYLKNSGLQIVACTEKSNKDVFYIDLTPPTAIIMGSEEDGIMHEYIEQCHLAVKIPMQGKISSLNVSVATGVILFETMRQRTV